MSIHLYIKSTLVLPEILKQTNVLAVQRVDSLTLPLQRLIPYVLFKASIRGNLSCVDRLGIIVLHHICLCSSMCLSLAYWWHQQIFVTLRRLSEPPLRAVLLPFDFKEWLSALVSLLFRKYVSRRGNHFMGPSTTQWRIEWLFKAPWRCCQDPMGWVVITILESARFRVLVQFDLPQQIS